MSLLKLSDVERRQICSICNIFDALSKMLLCHQKGEHVRLAKHLLEILAKDESNNFNEEINSTLMFLKTNVEASRLAYLIGLGVNSLGLADQNLMKIQKTVMDKYKQIFERHKRSPLEVWHECQFVQSKLDAEIESMNKDYKLFKRELHSRREKFKHGERTNGQSVKVSLPKSFRKEKPSPPFSEQVLLRKQHAFSRIVAATQAILLIEESSAHFLYASLAVEILFESFPEGSESSQASKRGKKLPQYHKSLNEFEKLVFDYSACLERIFSTLSINDLLTVYLRPIHSEEATKLQKLLASVGEGLRSEINKQDLISLNESTFRDSLSKTNICNMAYEAYISLFNTFRKAECLLYKRNLEAMRLFQMNRKTNPQSSEHVKLLDKLEAPDILIDLGIFCTPVKEDREVNVQSLSILSPHVNVAIDQHKNSSCSKDSPLQSGELSCVEKAFVNKSNTSESLGESLIQKQSHLTEILDSSFPHQEVQVEISGGDFTNEGPDFTEVDVFLTENQKDACNSINSQGLMSAIGVRDAEDSPLVEEIDPSNDPQHLPELFCETQLDLENESSQEGEDHMAVRGLPSTTVHKIDEKNILFGQSEVMMGVAAALGAGEQADRVHISEDALEPPVFLPNPDTKENFAQPSDLVSILPLSSGGTENLLGGGSNDSKLQVFSWETGLCNEPDIVHTSALADAVEILNPVSSQAEWGAEIAETGTVGIPPDIVDTGQGLDFDNALAADIQFLQFQEAGTAEANAKSRISTASVEVVGATTADFAPNLNEFTSNNYVRNGSSKSNQEQASVESRGSRSDETGLISETNESKEEYGALYGYEVQDDLFREQLAAVDAGYGLNTERVLNLPFGADELLNGRYGMKGWFQYEETG